MKHFSLKSLLLIFCFMVSSCEDNFESYKDKFLEYTASQLNTTKELLVKDLDIKFDSMSISYFLVEDSILFIKQDCEEAIEKQNNRIASCKKDIERKEAEIEKNKGDRMASIFSAFNNTAIEKYKNNIKEAEKKIEELKKKCEEDLKKYEGRNDNDVIFNVFNFQIAAKHPIKNIHEVSKEAALFSPDGQSLIDNNAGKRIKEHLKSKKAK